MILRYFETCTYVLTNPIRLHSPGRPTTVMIIQHLETSGAIAPRPGEIQFTLYRMQSRNLKGSRSRYVYTNVRDKKIK